MSPGGGLEEDSLIEVKSDPLTEDYWTQVQYSGSGNQATITASSGEIINAIAASYGGFPQPIQITIAIILVATPLMRYVSPMIIQVVTQMRIAFSDGITSIGDVAKVWIVEHEKTKRLIIKERKTRRYKTRMRERGAKR